MKVLVKRKTINSEIQKEKEIIMTFPQVLEVAIGLVLLYYVLGSVVSAFAKLIQDSFEVRGKALLMYLVRIFGGDLSEILDFPQIRSLRQIKFKNMFSILTGTTEHKSVERIPVPMLVNALFDYAGLTVLEKPTPATLAEHINTLSESEARSALLKWVSLGITNIDHLRERVTEYFTGVMDEVEDRVSANSRSFMFSFALTITLILGIDSFQVARELWNNADLRAVSSAVSNIASDKGGEAATSSAGSVDISRLPIKIGWMANDYPVNGSATDWIKFLVLKMIGLSVTMACVSQGSAFWYGLLKKLD